MIVLQLQFHPNGVQMTKPTQTSMTRTRFEPKALDQDADAQPIQPSHY